MVKRLIQIALAVGAFLGLAAVACLLAVILITGKDPVSAARDAARQWMLSQRSIALNAPAGTETQSQRFVVAAGTGSRQIAQNLLAANLITDVELFLLYVAANGIDAQLEAGTYFLSNSMTIPEIATRLTDSNSSQITFRILEGWRKEEIAEAIDASRLFGFTGAEFLAVVGQGASVPPQFAAYVGLPAGASLEGFLYPDTYLLPPSITALELRDLLLETFMSRVGVELVNAALAQNLTLYEVVILASISEREAVHAEEHPLILSVYRNRLNIGMKLDADPTVQYPLNNTRGSWWGQITRADYTGVNSPYNTYLYTGLPPSPISNPALASIQAAIYPQQTDYFYFRAACDGSGFHEFAVTYEEHLTNGCTG